MRARVVAGGIVVMASAFACHGRGASWPLAPNGANALDEKQSAYADDGAGLLARAALHLWVGSESEDDDDDDAPAATVPTALGGEDYGNPFAVNAFGSDYAHWQPATFNASNVVGPNENYDPVDGLNGAIEGTIAWSGAVPAAFKSACGAIEPTVRLGSRRGVRGALIYVEKIESGRPAPSGSRPMGIGGTLGKRGCGFEPIAQIVAPSPSPVAIYGDDHASTVTVALPDGTSSSSPLEPGAVTDVVVPLGVTRVSDAAGTSGGAWFVGIDTPYYAITDDDGHFRLDELPPGPITVTVWQPPIARAGANGSVTFGDPIVAHRTVTVVAQKIAAMNVSLGR